MTGDVNDPLYLHRQTATVTLAALGGGALVALALVLANAVEGGPAAVIAGAVLAFVLVLMSLFASLTVEVTEARVSLWFGPGLIRRTIDVARIRSATAVRNRWWYGWGIRLTPHGWLWNVSGLDAVELAFDDGRRFRIGTDEPERLAAAITSVLRHR